MTANLDNHPSATEKNGLMVYDWIIKYLPPLTWNILSINLGEFLLEKHINPLQIDENTVFDQSVLNKVDFFLRDQYNVSLFKDGPLG
ncbi:MAG: hypothetical protein ACNS62_00585 [Candidatus Cyclobacteriaceae bacterium M3_2C_046]